MYIIINSWSIVQWYANNSCVVIMIQAIAVTRAILLAIECQYCQLSSYWYYYHCNHSSYHFTIALPCMASNILEHSVGGDHCHNDHHHNLIWLMSCCDWLLHKCSLILCWLVSSLMLPLIWWIPYINCTTTINVMQYMDDVW